MKKILEFFKDKVFISSLITSLMLFIQQATQSGPTDLKALGMGALILVLGIVGKHLKGAGLSILGIIGGAITAFVQVYQTGEFKWETFIPMAALAILSVIAPTASPEKKEDSKPPYPYNSAGR